MNNSHLEFMNLLLKVHFGTPQAPPSCSEFAASELSLESERSSNKRIPLPEKFQIMKRNVQTKPGFDLARALETYLDLDRLGPKLLTQREACEQSLASSLIAWRRVLPIYSVPTIQDMFLSGCQSRNNPLLNKPNWKVTRKFKRSITRWKTIGKCIRF